MYSLTQRSGFFARQSKKVRTFKINYFYIDSYGCLYYLSNLALLNHYIKNSLNEGELVEYLEDCVHVKKIIINICRISAIKTFTLSENTPFYHKTCFELNVQINNHQKQLFIFATIEDDIDKLQEIMKQGFQRSNSVQRSNSSPHRQNEYQDCERKQQFLKQVLGLFQKYKVELENLNEDNKAVIYVGQVQNGKPHGEGQLFFDQEGIHFKGQFKEGKKHGIGYIADTNLDQIQCEFIDDILTGI
ncbi:hypothetical protein pb186bvf_000691 [Paramecium bursaria]